MKKILSVLILVFAAVSAYAFDISRLTLTQGVQYTKLPNGLTVIIKEEHSVPLAGLAVGYRVGFRNDDIHGRTGLTHLLEHMMFKGTVHYPKGEISRTLDELGADFNAFTGYDSTVYWEVLPAAGLPTAMDIEADRMVNSLMDPAEFASERMVVYSEIANNQSAPDYKLEDKFFGETFGEHPLRYLSGRLEDITNVSRDYVYNELYKKYYCPNNAIVVVVGDVKAADALAMVKKYFGGIPANPNLPKETPIPLTVKRGVDIRMEGVASESFGEAVFDLPKYDPNDKDFVALYALQKIGLSGDFGYWATEDFGLGFLNYSDEPAVPSEALDKAYIRAKFDELRDEAFSSELMSYDSLRSIMFTLYGFERDGSYKDYDKLNAAVASLTAGDVIRVIDKYLVRSNMSQAFFKATTLNPHVRPQSSGTTTAESFGSDIDYSSLEHPTPEMVSNAAARKAALFAGTITSFSNYLSTVRTVTLPNGITVIYKPFGMTEKVSIGIGFRGAGTIDQVKPKQASIAMSMVFDGGPQILKWNALALRGARFSGGAGYDNSSYSLDVILEDFTNAVDCLSLAVENRTFMPLVFEEKKFIAENGWKLLQKSPDASAHASYMINGMLYGRQGAGLDYCSDDRDISRLTLQDVNDFYRSFVRPENMVVVVVGKVPFDSVTNALASRLGSWTQLPATMSVRQPVIRTPSGDVVKRYPLDVMQDIVIMGSPTVDYSDKTNYTALSLANQIFGGGGLTSRLMRSIRDREGLTYGVGTWPRPYGSETSFMLWMQNNPDQVEKALKIYDEELAKYKQEGPTDLEVLMFQTSNLNSMLFEYENGSKIASALLGYTLRRGRYDYSIEYLNILNGLDKDDLLKVIRQYFPEDYFIAIAGK